MATASCAPQAFQWSDLARRSSEVGDALDADGQVTVTRGSQVLTITRASSESTNEAITDLCRILAALVRVGDPSSVRSVLNAAWPWTRVLPDVDQLELAREVGDTAEICDSLGTWGPMGGLLGDWRRTARAWADGGGPTHIVEPMEILAARPE
jgi:hypothetical protein